MHFRRKKLQKLKIIFCLPLGAGGWGPTSLAGNLVFCIVHLLIYTDFNLGGRLGLQGRAMESTPLLGGRRRRRGFHRTFFMIPLTMALILVLHKSRQDVQKYSATELSLAYMQSGVEQDSGAGSFPSTTQPEDREEKISRWWSSYTNNAKHNAEVITADLFMFLQQFGVNQGTWSQKCERYTGRLFYDYRHDRYWTQNEDNQTRAWVLELAPGDCRVCVGGSCNAHQNTTCQEDCQGANRGSKKCLLCQSFKFHIENQHMEIRKGNYSPGYLDTSQATSRIVFKEDWSSPPASFSFATSFHDWKQLETLVATFVHHPANLSRIYPELGRPSLKVHETKYFLESLPKTKSTHLPPLMPLPPIPKSGSQQLPDSPGTGIWNWSGGGGGGAGVQIMCGDKTLVSTGGGGGRGFFVAGGKYADVNDTSESQEDGEVRPDILFEGGMGEGSGLQMYVPTLGEPLELVRQPVWPIGAGWGGGGGWGDWGGGGGGDEHGGGGGGGDENEDEGGGAGGGGYLISGESRQQGQENQESQHNGLNWQGQGRAAQPYYPAVPGFLGLTVGGGGGGGYGITSSWRVVHRSSGFSSDDDQKIPKDFAHTAKKIGFSNCMQTLTRYGT